MWALMWVILFAVAVTVVIAVFAVGRFALDTLRRARDEEAAALARRRAQGEAAREALEAGGDAAAAGDAGADTPAQGR